MKKLLIIGGLIFFVGCATKTEKMATSVVELMGDEKVVGWSDNKDIEKPKVVYKTVIKYKTIPLKDSDKDGIIDKLDKCPNTPKGLLVNHYGCPIITTLRLNFDFNKVFVK
jgi:OOP family OmpA-OmpF porin